MKRGETTFVIKREQRRDREKILFILVNYFTNNTFQYN